MSDFFSAAYWLDIIQEDYFWPSVAIVLILGGGLLCLIYLDRFKRWQATRQERNKMRQWLRPKS